LTIGRAKPIGICGSGLIDTVAELFQGGIIDQNGKFSRELDTDRVREGSDGYEYVLAWKKETGIKEDIVLTEIDIENLIRTKAAIYAGCKILLDSVGLGFQGPPSRNGYTEVPLRGKWVASRGSAPFLFEGLAEGDGADRPYDDQSRVEQ
jgi:hypothetical protein